MGSVQQKIRENIRTSLQQHARELGAEGKSVAELSDDQLTRLGMLVEQHLNGEVSPIQVLEGLINAKLEDLRRAAASPNLARGDVDTNANTGQRDLTVGVTSMQMKTAWAPSAKEIKAAASAIAETIKRGKGATVELGYLLDGRITLRGDPNGKLDARVAQLIDSNDARLLRAINDALEGSGVSATRLRQDRSKTVGQGTKVEPLSVDVKRM